MLKTQISQFTNIRDLMSKYCKWFVGIVLQVTIHQSRHQDCAHLCWPIFLFCDLLSHCAYTLWKLCKYHVKMKHIGYSTNKITVCNRKDIRSVKSSTRVWNRAWNIHGNYSFPDFPRRPHFKSTEYLISTTEVSYKRKTNLK